MTWAWLGIIIGIVIVALAVGIPYLLTHRVMPDPHDLSGSHDYVQAKRRWRRRQGASSARSGQTPGSQGTTDSLQTRNGPQV